jgi:predicted phage terminase large subunit-like protein
VATVKKPSDKEYAAILRSNFYGFIERSFNELNPVTVFKDNFHIEVLAYELERVRLGETKRLIINVPPRSLKSHCASIAFPAWILGHEPGAQIICASYAQDLSDKLANDCRTLIMSPMYKKIFSTRLSSLRPAVHELITTRRGFRLATSVGGVLTGRGADYIIIDDPLKPDEAASEVERKKVNDWYDHSLLTRLNDKRDGRIILIMQRLHQDDLVGHVLAKEDCRVVRFPAIAEEDETFRVPTLFGPARTYSRKKGEALHPEREDLVTLEKIKSNMGSYNFAGQYLQSPAPPGGGMIKEHWFKTYTPQNRPETFDYVFQSWDTANKVTELSDYSVCTTWGKKGKNLYLLHVYRKKMDYPTLKRAVVEQALLWSARLIVIEDKASGTQLIQELTYEGVYNIQRYQPGPNEDKAMRMYFCCNVIENGFVYLPEKADWLPEYLNEVTVFPNGKYDDQVDSTSQALDWIKRRYLERNAVTITTVYRKRLTNPPVRIAGCVL